MIKCHTPDPRRLKHRMYTPHTIELCDWEQLKPLFDDLVHRKISSEPALEQLIIDASDLASALQEEYARIQLATSRNTADTEARDRFNHYNENILSQTAALFEQIDGRILDSEFLDGLAQLNYSQLIRLMKNTRRLFRKENIPLTIEGSKLAEEYSALTGGFTVEFDGETRNLTQMSEYLLSTDRDIREKAYRVIAECRYAHRDEIDDIYDRLLELREQTGVNAGFENFRDYQHLTYSRFDYTPEDCFKFHATVEEHAVPILRKRGELRRNKLGLDKLRPWDLAMDPDNHPPLKPFKTQDELVEGCGKILDKVYPDLGNTLRLLDDHGHLDLMTRTNKATVGFNMPLVETRVSFVFMNAAGLHKDLTVLLHESGHAIETIACAEQKILHYRHTPQEWGECASQATELISMPFLDVFYSDPEVRRRCIIEKLEDTVATLVHAAKIDAFQQWVYTHPGHTREERNATWNSLSERFGETVDYTGLEHYRRNQWQGIPHLFIVPFYYIEYGIAQLAALQVYRKFLKEGQPALKNWFDAMKFGYSKTIPELYEAAGLKFNFHGDFAAELIQFLADEIDRVETMTF